MLVDFRWLRLELLDVFVKMNISFHPVYQNVLRIHSIEVFSYLTMKSKLDEFSYSNNSVDHLQIVILCGGGPFGFFVL